MAETIDRLERATQGRDFAVICDDLLTDEARGQAGGADCVRRLRIASSELRRPAIRVLTIRIDGVRADVRVVSTAAGQRPVKETIRLIRRDGSYRIAALDG